MFRITILTVAALMLCLGCAGAEKTTDHDTEAAVETTTDTPPPTTQSADLAGFPMPETLPGEHYVEGEIHHTSKYVNLVGFYDVAFRREGDKFVVNINGAEVNCCTESLRAAISEKDGAVTVRLYEYLPDVCECTHKRDIWFNLKGIEEITSVTVYLNDETEPVPEPDC